MLTASRLATLLAEAEPVSKAVLVELERCNNPLAAFVAVEAVRRLLLIGARESMDTAEHEAFQRCVAQLEAMFSQHEQVAALSKAFGGRRQSKGEG